MNRNGTSARLWLISVVIAHLIIALVHGVAHDGAQVPLSRATNLFVFVVIVAGPLIGVVLALRAEQIGNWLIAITLAASFIFGVVNHFVFASPDQVAHVARPWQPLFAATVVLLAVSEALGSALALYLVREGKIAS